MSIATLTSLVFRQKASKTKTVNSPTPSKLSNFSWSHLILNFSTSHLWRLPIMDGNQDKIRSCRRRLVMEHKKMRFMMEPMEPVRNRSSGKGRAAFCLRTTPIARAARIICRGRNWILILGTINRWVPSQCYHVFLGVDDTDCNLL